MTFKQYKSQILKDPRSEKLNFNKVDNRYYYIYRIIENNKEYYYGSRVSSKYPEIDLPEYGSTSKRKKLVKENKDNIYTFKIVKVLDNNGDKILWEAYLHQYFNVKLHPKFWNEANQTPFGFDTTGISSWNKDRTPSTKTKKILREKAIKRYRDGTVAKRSDITQDTKDKISKTIKDRGVCLGANNSQAKEIIIYNNKDEIVYKINGEFKQTCKNNNLPFKALTVSYQNNGQRLYQKRQPIDAKYLTYIGWYAKIVGSYT